MPEPRMPPIKNLEFLDLVGVISSPCTTNERPHSKLGWMTPRAYANAFSGEAIHKTESSNQSRTLVIPG